MHCKCKDERTWYLTRHCACVKAKVKGSVACNSGKNIHGGPTCPNIPLPLHEAKKDRRFEIERKNCRRVRREVNGKVKNTGGKLEKSRK